MKRRGRAAGPTSRAQLTLGFVLLIVLALLPPSGLDTYWQSVVITSLYFTIVAYGWNLLSGYTGLFSLAPAAFSMLGAYVSALLWTYAQVPPIAGITAGCLFTAATGMVIGLLTLRLAGPYLALTTLAFAEILRLVALNSFDVTGGEIGLKVPPVFPGEGGYYYLFISMTAVVVAGMHLFINSRFGLFLRAIRDDEVGARARGVPTVFWKVFAFSVSSGMSGLAGAVFGSYVTIVSPSLGHLLVTGGIISMVVIGGMGTLLGPLLGAILVTVSSELLRAIGDLEHIVFALLLILFARFCREGITGLLPTLLRFGQGRPQAKAVDEATAP